jgi:hypothetical protein
LSAIHKLIHAVWNKEELSDQWKEPIIVPVNKRGDKTDSINYRGISLLTLPTSGGHSVGIVRPQTQTTKFVFVLFYHCYELQIQLYQISSQC